MKFRTLFAGAAVVAAVALAPAAASAQGASCVMNTPSLGIGGSLSGCFTFTMSELGENAGYVSQQYYWAGNFNSATGAPNNAPNPAGTKFFSDDCGSSGSTNGPATTFAFCPVDAAHTVGPILNPSGELVLGLDVPDPTRVAGGTHYWIFSGSSARNAFPAPAGFQQVLYQLTTGGVADPGQFLFAWEDLNSGCLSLAGSTLHPSLTTFATEDLGNKVVLDNPNNCNSLPVPGWSDNDYNDSYILISVPQGQQLQVVPEPMTMTMMATGLVGLAGAGLRRRRNKIQG